jgi:lipid A ethanolaminephosphotransferase
LDGNEAGPKDVRPKVRDNKKHDLALGKSRRLIKPLLIALLLLNSVIAYFTSRYGAIFDHEMIENILETQVAEARDIYNFKLIVYIALLGVLPSVAIYFARLSNPNWKVETFARMKLLSVAVLTLAVFTFRYSARLTAMKHEHREIVGKVNPTYALSSAVKLFKRNCLTRRYEHLAVGADARTPAEDVHRELMIIFSQRCSDCMRSARKRTKRIWTSSNTLKKKK